MTEKNPHVRPWRIPLDGPEIDAILSLVGGFHDAVLDSSRYEARAWILEIRHTYFPVERRYDAFGTDGCVLHLAGCDVHEDMVEAAQDRELFGLELATSRLDLVFSFDGMEMAGITFAPERSFLEWRFKQR